MRRGCLTLMILLLFVGRTNTFAVDKKPIAEPAIHRALVADTGKLTVRHLDTGALNRYSRDPDFNYTHEREEQQMSWWERIWYAFWRWVDSLFPKSSGGGNVVGVIKFLLIAAFAGLIIWLITRLFHIDLLKLFGKKKKDEGIPYTEQTENIHEINFDDALGKALQDRNYRLAVRLLYLRSLKQLNDAGLIHWRIEKTNLAYLNELENPEYKRLFGALTVRFEYVWYGDFPINNEVFQNIDSLFRDFSSGLK